MVISIWFTTIGISGTSGIFISWSECALPIRVFFRLNYRIGRWLNGSFPFFFYLIIIFLDGKMSTKNAQRPE